MTGLSTGASGLWGGNPGLLFTTGLSTGTGLLANLVPSWVLPGAVLDLYFANSLGFNSAKPNQTTPNSILTYTSPSAKMVYGSDGVLGYAPHNLLLQSKNLVTSWTSTNLTATAVAPDGSTTAASLIPTTANTTHKHGQAINPIGVNSNYEFSVKLKANGYNKVALNESAQTATSSKIVDLRDGTSINAVGTAGTTTVTDAGGGYWLIKWLIPAFIGSNKFLQIVVLPDSASAATNPHSTAWIPDGVSGVLAADATGCNAPYQSGTYLPTTTAAVYSLPIDYNPTTFEPLGVLVEEQRVNLLTYSEQFNNAAWTKSDATISANAVVAPDGTTTADKLVEAATTAAHAVYQTLTVTAVAHTFSVYLKAAERTWAYVRNPQAAAQGAWFDLSNGVVGTVEASITAAIQSVGNGWYRCSVTRTMTAGNDYPSVGTATADNISSFAGDITKGIYVWGAQLEAGAFATSYVPTVASQSTRLADQVSILTSAFGYNATAGTVAYEVEPAAVSFPFAYEFSDGTSSDRILSNAGATAHLAVVDGGASQADIDAGTITAGAFNKAAQAFSANDFAAVIAGGTVGTDTSGTMPTVTTLRLGYQFNGVNFLNGHIKRLTYFPTRRTNADLQGLTRGDDLVWGDYLVWGSGNNLTW